MEEQDRLPLCNTFGAKPLASPRKDRALFKVSKQQTNYCDFWTTCHSLYSTLR